MVKLYEPRLSECGVNMVEMGNGDWVSYEDYAKMAKSVRACVAAIQEGSLTIEHVQGYLEGVIGVLDD